MNGDFTVRILFFTFLIITISGHAFSQSLFDLDPSNIANKFRSDRLKSTTLAIEAMNSSTPIFFAAEEKTLEVVDVDQVADSLKDGDDLSYRDLRNINLSGKSLTDINFLGSDLRGANFDGATLKDVVLSGADISSASFVSAKFLGTYGEFITSIGSDFTGAEFKGGYWPYAKIHFARLIDVQLDDVVMNGATFHQTAVSNARFEAVNFWGAFFEKSVFNETKFVRSQFIGVIHEGNTFKDVSFLRSIMRNQFMANNNARALSFDRMVFGPLHSNSYELNYVSKEWIDEVAMLSLGFTYREGSTLKTTSLGDITFDSDTAGDFYQEMFIRNFINTILSYRYWETINNLAAVQREATSASKKLRSINLAGVDATAILSFNFVSPGFSFHTGSIREHLDSTYGLKANEGSNARTQRSATEPQREQTPTDYYDIVGYDDLLFTLSPHLAACVALYCQNGRWNNTEFWRRLINTDFSKVKVLEILNAANYQEAATLLKERYNGILNFIKASEVGELKINSFYRGYGSRHPFGAMDFAFVLRQGDGTEIDFSSDVSKKRTVAKEISKSAGKSHLVILEEQYWVEEGVTVPRGTQAARDRGELALDRFRKREKLRNGNTRTTLLKPIISNPEYRNSIPGDDQTVIAMHTYFLNGRRLEGGTWTKSVGSEHMHIQQRPREGLPYWARRFLNPEHKRFKANNYDLLPRRLQRRTRQFFVDSLLTKKEERELNNSQ